MTNNGPSPITRFFADAATGIAWLTGRPSAFLACCVLVIVWAAFGPASNYSDTWLLIINTVTTIVTFLMVFLIQNTQNRDGAAIQAKLDQLILVGKGANRYVGIEKLTDDEIEELREKCRERAKQEILGAAASAR
jgi:low affinity Fe/Cu permease